MKRFGIKGVMLIAMFAWVLRFGLFGLGNPTMPGVILFILSMIVYGVAFDFFNVSGSLYVDRQTPPAQRSSAQGLFMIMTNGIGATIGTLGAQAIIDRNVLARPEGWHRSTDGTNRGLSLRLTHSLWPFCSGYSSATTNTSHRLYKKKTAF